MKKLFNVRGLLTKLLEVKHAMMKKLVSESKQLTPLLEVKRAQMKKLVSESKLLILPHEVKRAKMKKLVNVSKLLIQLLIRNRAAEFLSNDPSRLPTLHGTNYYSNLTAQLRNNFRTLTSVLFALFFSHMRASILIIMDFNQNFATLIQV